MAVRIGLATIRDVSYILAHLRPGDLDEIMCQLPDGVAPVDLAAAHVNFGRSWVAYHNDIPAMAFGVQPMTLAGNAYNAWAFGTRRAKGVLREVVRFGCDVIVPAWIGDGVSRIEARSLGTHSIAHRWMVALGAEHACDLPLWGRDGEAFKLFVWYPTSASLARLGAFCG